jgi:hypothetical protein
LPFHVHISDREQAYLDNLPLSSQAKENIKRFVEEFFAEVTDEFRLDPQNRPFPNLFLTRYVILDYWGDRGMHTIDFYVQDDKITYGILLIVYIEHH